MVALTQNRDTQRRSGDMQGDPVAANTRIFQGSLVVLDAAGNAAPGSTALNLVSRGVAHAEVDNTGGAAGDLTVQTRRGVFSFKNDGTAPCDRTHIGKDVYIVDDQTIASTDGTGTRSKAGVLRDIDANGAVWVEV